MGYRKMGDIGALADTTAKLIADGNVIGWFQGRMEFGPRAPGRQEYPRRARSPECRRRSI